MSSAREARDTLRRLRAFCVEQELIFRAASFESPILAGVANSYKKASDAFNELLQFERQIRHQGTDE